MRILFLTQVLPYPVDAGPKARAYYTLCHLSRQHEVDLLSFVRPGDPPGAIEHLRAFCGAVHTVPLRRSRARDVRHLLHSLAGDTPFLVARDWVPAMARSVQALVQPGSRGGERHSGDAAHADATYDVLHADQLWMAPYALLARRAVADGRRPAIVLDQHNAVFQIPRRLAQHEANPLKRALLAREGHMLARYEARVCRQVDHVVWVTHEDRAALGAQTAGARGEPAFDARPSSVIPICADPARQQVIQRRPDARRVTFLGGLHWPPNAEGILWFARDVWPYVWRQAPGAVLTVIGKNPPRALSTIGEPRSVVEITGYVADPTPYLAETAAFIVPLHAGGGMRVKILDAWCRGVPVVTTRVGAEGIRVQDGENALLADGPEAFAHAVARLLREPGLAAHLATEGRQSVEAHYDWSRVYQAWDRVYERLEGGER